MSNQKYAHLWSEKYDTIEDLRCAVLEIEVPEKRDENDMFVHWYGARRFLSYFSWDLFTAHCYLHYARQTGKKTPPSLSEKHMLQGQLEPAAAKELYDTFKECPAYDPPVTGKEICPGHYFGPGVSEGTAQRTTEVYVTRKVTKKMDSVLRSILDNMKEMLEETMGHYWRVGQVRMYEFQPDKKKDNYGWHSDGWPKGLKKIYFYLDGASLQKGTTEFRHADGTTSHIEGPPGVWGLFENSLITHHAYPSDTEVRPAIEISFYPSLVTDTTPVHMGITGNHPWYPLDYDDIANCPAIPEAFLADALEFRTLSRTMGLARHLPFTDCSLGNDEFLQPEGWDPETYVPKQYGKEINLSEDSDLQKALEEIHTLRNELDTIYESRSWALAERLRKIYRSLIPAR